MSQPGARTTPTQPAAVRAHQEALFDVPLAALTGAVPAAAVDEAIAQARFTPSAANLQPWTFIRLTQAGSIRTVAEHSLNSLGLPMPNHRNDAILNVAHLVLVCMNVLRAKCRFGQRGVDQFAVQDVAAAAHAVRLAALELGVASHWIRELDFAALDTALQLTPRLRLQAVLAFGQAPTGQLERPPRLDPHQFSRVEPAPEADPSATRPPEQTKVAP